MTVKKDLESKFLALEMIKNKFSIRKILKLKVENDVRFFEVEWEKTWEKEEYIRQVAPDLLDEYLSKEKSYDIKFKNETTLSNETSDTIASFTYNESLSKPRRIGGIQAVISRLKMSHCIEQKPALCKITKAEQSNDQVAKSIDKEKFNKSPNQLHDPDRSKVLIDESNSTEDFITQHSSLTREPYSTIISANVKPNANSKFTSKSHHLSTLRENNSSRNTNSHAYNQLSVEKTALSFENSGVFFKCSICSEVLYEDMKYRQHMYMHEQVSLLKKDPPKLLKPGTFECKFCNMIFDGKDKLKTHYNENHEREFADTQPTDQLYSCSQCQKSFLDLSALQKHLEMHPVHAGRATENSDEKVAKIKEEIDDLDEYSDQQPCNTNFLYLSPQNQKISENKKFLKNSPSMATMTTLDFQPVNEVLMLKKGDCRLIDNLDDKKFFRCNLCDEMFETESERAQHSLIHVDRSNSLDCHICGKQFRHRTNLTTHLIVHSGVKPHQCSVCFRRFTQKVNLQRHMHIHEGSRPYRCSMCSKSFTQKANLQRHILSHTEQNKDEFIQASRDSLSESDFIDESNDFIDDGVEKSNTYLPSTKEITDVSNNNNENLVSFERQEFRCDICEKTFAQKANLHKHLLIHSGSKPFQCYVCGKAFRQRSSLQKHYTIHTNGSSSFMCQTCNRMFGSRTNLQRHMLVHVASNTECYICYQKCTTSDNLERHFSEHIEEASLAMSLPQKYFEKSSGETFYCVDCGISFDNPIVYNQHLQCHQKDADDSRNHQRLHDGASPLQCEVCGVIFMSSTKLKEHIEVQHTSSKIAFDANIKSSENQPAKPLENCKLLAPKFKDVRTSFPIKFISRHDNNSENLKERKQTRVSRCPVCKQIFLSKVHMKEHYATVHRGENNDSKNKNVQKPVTNKSLSFSISLEQCEIDKLPLNSSSDISIHKVEPDEKDDDEVELITEDEEQMIKDNQEFIKDNILGGSHEYESKGRYERGNYSCKICNRTLTYKYSLEKHMLIHTGIYPYKCHLCSKRFNHKPNLDKHLVVHSGEKPHVCHLCHRAFSQRSNLQRHQLTHTQNRDFVCEICGKRFNHMASLKTHSLIHTGAKPFSCYICTKRFNQKGNLKRHVQTHKTGKRNRLSNESKLNEIEFSEESYYNGENSDYSDDDLSSVPGKKEDYMSAEEPLPTMLDDLSQSNSVTSDKSGQPKTSVLDEFNQDSDDILTIVPSDELSEFGKQKIKNKKESYHCDSCSKLFVSMASLESHKRAHHSLIVCDVCGKQFSQKANLLKHKLIHMNKKPFPCQTCHKAFRQKANLQRHEMIHNKERKSLSCEICQKSFRCLWSLKQHVKNHPERTSFSCSFCGETFEEKAQLLRHYVVHKGITVYSCYICLQKYQSKDNLLAHMTTHENVPSDIQQRIEEDEGHDLLTQDDIPVDIEPTFVVKMDS